MPLPLPPLNALRAFEAAARTGGYVAAANELGVSAAAVSQQVRNLEAFLGKQLFMRFNNRVVLTDAGQAIFAGASEALQSISMLTRHAMAGPARARLVISVLPSVVDRWLVPRLAALVRREAGFLFDLRVEDDPVDFARHDIDLRICYGTNLYPDMHAIHLVQDEVLPLCSPDYLKRNVRASMPLLSGVPDDDLIHTNWGPNYGSHPSWQAWFARSGVNRPDDRKGNRAGMSGLALALARDGVGVALGQRMLAVDDIKNGRLFVLSDTAIALGHPYSLAHPHRKIRKPGLALLIDWLKGGDHAVDRRDG